LLSDPTAFAQLQDPAMMAKVLAAAQLQDPALAAMLQQAVQVDNSETVRKMAVEAALREPARAAAQWCADAAAAVAARKAAAPPEVRLVLDDISELDALIARDRDVAKRVAHNVVDWLVGAHAAAHGDAATKSLARLVLGIPYFATNMEAFGVWNAYKEQLQALLQALGAPLGAACREQGHCATLGGFAVVEHMLVAKERARCAAVGIKYELRSDMAGLVPVPAAWEVGVGADPSERQWHERVFIHMLKMIAMALNEEYHEMMRETLGPIVVSGKGVMAQNKDSSWRLAPEKGIARMECKRVTDHSGLNGCRPAANIDVLRVIGVCETPEQLQEVMEKMNHRFGGCGRVKNGFATSDEKAAAGFHLRVMLANFIVNFICTYEQLAEKEGVAEMWKKHVEQSAPEGGAPRDRWRDEAAAALAVLTSAEFADQPVRFICEAQMMLRQTYDTRAHMHEVREFVSC
jgi:hypothetical protein